MFPLAERMKLVSESITLAVSAKANALKRARATEGLVS